MCKFRSVRKFRSFLTFQLSFLLLICILLVNIYLFHHLKSIGYKQNTAHVLQNEQIRRNLGNITNRKVPQRICRIGNYSVFVSDAILQLKEDLEEFYLNPPNVSVIKLRCLKFLQTSRKRLKTDLISTENEIDLTNNQLVPHLKEAKILRIENALQGTQLKLLAHLADNITALVKPKWYSHQDIIIGPVYAGKDRHYGEVVAFYLSILLELPRVPPAVIRYFDLQKEIIEQADQKLLDTFIRETNKTCFYGVCPYCKPSDLLCTNSKILEGSLIYHLSTSYTLKTVPHPWRRTYRCDRVARWELDENYCTLVRKSQFYSNEQNKAVFLDIIDVAIFDFLISNGDRHHYEFIENFKIPRLLIIDNGKSFGNPYVDHVDVLAPLYQCCLLRNTTWSNLLLLRGGGISKWLKILLRFSDRNVKMNEMHFQALDRRLLLVISTLKYCFQKIGIQNVLVHE